MQRRLAIPGLGQGSKCKVAGLIFAWPAHYDSGAVETVARTFELDTAGCGVRSVPRRWW